MFGRLAALIIFVTLIVSCAWIVGQVPRAMQQSADAAHEISAAQAQAMEAQARSTAVILDAEGGYNYNNAQATAIIIDSEGEYIEHVARATQIIADSDQGPLNTYNAGRDAQREIAADNQRSLGAGFGIGTVVIALIGIVLFLVWAAAR